MMFINDTDIGTVTRVVGLEPGVEMLDLENGVGDIRVEPGRPGMIEVIAKLKANREHGPATDRDIEITQGDGRIKVRVADSPFASRRVSFEIRVPMSLNIRVRLGVGSIDISGLNARHDLRTGVGSINVQAERISGDSRFATGTGKVSVSAHRAEGSIEGKVGAGNFSFTAGSAMLDRCSFKVATGNIHLHLPATYIGAIDLKTALGAIKLGADAQFVPLQSMLVGSRAKGSLGQGQGEVVAHVAVGNVSLERK